MPGAPALPCCNSGKRHAAPQRPNRRGFRRWRDRSPFEPRGRTNPDTSDHWGVSQRVFLASTKGTMPAFRSPKTPRTVHGGRKPGNMQASSSRRLCSQAGIGRSCQIFTAVQRRLVAVIAESACHLDPAFTHTTTPYVRRPSINAAGLPSLPRALGLGTLFVPSHPLRHCRGRPAHRAACISDACQTLDTHWLNGVSNVLAGGLWPPARTLRLPRTTRPRFAFHGAQRMSPHFYVLLEACSGRN